MLPRKKLGYHCLRKKGLQFLQINGAKNVELLSRFNRIKLLFLIAITENFFSPFHRKVIRANNRNTRDNFYRI